MMVAQSKMDLFETHNEKSLSEKSKANSLDMELSRRGDSSDEE